MNSYCPGHQQYRAEWSIRKLPVSSRVETRGLQPGSDAAQRQRRQPLGVGDRKGRRQDAVPRQLAVPPPRRQPLGRRSGDDGADAGDTAHQALLGEAPQRVRRRSQRDFPGAGELAPIRDPSCTSGPPRIPTTANS